MRALKLFLIIVFAAPTFVFAQAADLRSTQLTLIELLQQQIQLLLQQVQTLQKQVTDLQTELGATSAQATSTSAIVAEAEQTTEVLPEFTRSLSLGISGDDVRRLQQFLTKDRTIYPEGVISGYFGPLTERAVKKWQEKHGIEQVGRIGSKSLAKLNELRTVGAGKSGVIPLGLLTAPGIQQRLATTIIITTSTVATSTMQATTSVVYVTSTNVVATSTTATTTYIYTPPATSVPSQSSGGTQTTTATSTSGNTTASIAHTCGTPINVPQDTSSIQTALNSACSGDTVYVGTGTYYENISIPRSGITLKGASGTTAETVIIDGRGIQSGKVVSASGIQNFTIDGFTLQNSGQYGFGLRIDGPSTNGDVGTLVVRNLIVKNNTHGVWIQGVLAGNITFERNVVVNNQGTGVQMGTCGSSTANVINNTIANNDSYYAYLDNCLLGNRILRNNIIAQNNGYGIYLFPNSPRTILYNNVWNNTQGNYYAATAGTGDISADPKFVSASDYHLQSSSPVINAGDLSSQYNDSDGSRNDMGAYPFVTSTTGDTVAPTVPTNLTASSSNPTYVVLSWTASTDTVGVTGYKIYRNGSFVSNTAPTSTALTSYTDTGLSSGTSYTYTVAAYDAAGNVSAQSSSTNITTIILPVFTITSPNGGESWIAGNAYTITWTATGTPLATVNVELYKGGSYSMNIGYNVSNNGSLSWTVPSSIAAGSDYKIRVYNNMYYSNFDESDSVFGITVPVTAPSAQPIGYWKFDGNGNNEIAGSPAAVLVGSSTFNASGGKYGGYLYVPTQYDSAKIPYNSIFDLPDNFTIEFWFRQRSNQSFNQNLIYKGTPINNYNFNISRWLWNEYNYGPVIAGHTAANTGYWTQPSNANQLTHNEWHHVVFTKNPTYHAYYLDGVLIGSKEITATSNTEYGGPAKTPAVDIIIGDTAVDTDFDNVRIYNVALSRGEVLYNHENAPTSLKNFEHQLANISVMISRLSEEVRRLIGR